MEREELIKKWLDNNLTTKEQNAFEQLEDYKDLIQMNSALKGFKAPHFSVEKNYKTLESQLKTDASKTISWLKPLLRIAAILALSFSVYYYTTTLDSEFNTTIAQQTTIVLPDASTVHLNSNSFLTFNENHWNDARAVNLSGEAYFKVAKGQKFDVFTDSGIVSVLGTQFNVKQRASYFEVTCYEGLVAVTHNNKTIKLPAGSTYRSIDGKPNTNTKENSSEPSWLSGESSFKGVPLKFVISEFENQYNLKVNTKNVDTLRLFTGSFTHKNLDLALQSVTIPLNLSYSKSEKSILIKRE